MNNIIYWTGGVFDAEIDDATKENTLPGAKVYTKTETNGLYSGCTVFCMEETEYPVGVVLSRVMDGLVRIRLFNEGGDSPMAVVRGAENYKWRSEFDENWEEYY